MLVKKGELLGLACNRKSIAQNNAQCYLFFMTSFYVAMRNTFFLIFTMIFHLDVLMAGGEHPDFVNLYQRILDRQDDPNQLNNWIVDGYERALKDAELKKEQVRSASLGLTVDYYAELGGSENEVLGRSERAAVGLSLSMPVPIKALSTQAQNQVAQEDIRLKIAGATKAEAERLFIYNFAQSLIRISEREAQFFFAHSNLDVLERYHEKIKGLKESNYRAKFPNKNDEEIADLLHFDSELVNLEANIADQDLAVRQLLIDFNIEKRVFSEQIYQGEFSCEYIVNPCLLYTSPSPRD